MAPILPPSGFRDFLNNEAHYRLKLIKIISEVYQSFGFMPLETPALENLDLLLGRGGGEENEKLIFKVLKRGGKLSDSLSQIQNKSDGIEEVLSDLGLRFDLTLPLSRVVASHRNELRFPWKVFHIGPVWRAERPQKGRFREFIQCDVDIVGAKNYSAEIEVIQAVVTAIHRVGANGFELRLNDRRIIEKMAEKLEMTGPRLAQFAILLDKKDKLSEEEFLHQFKESGLTELREWNRLEKLLFSKLESNEAKLQEMAFYHDSVVTELRSMIQILEDLNLPLDRIVIDPSLVRGMGYYTGPVFELRHSSAGYSFGGGGRYDQLVGRFTAQSIPACGFSIGFERLALLLAEKDQKAGEAQAALFIPVFDEKLRGQILKIAQKLRTSITGDFRVDVYPDQTKLKNQFKFASDSGYRWLLLLGEEELNQRVYKMKDFQSGVETSVPADRLIEIVKKSILASTVA